MHDYKGDKVKQARPGEPVEILGFDSVPEAGEFVRVVENDRTRALARGREGPPHQDRVAGPPRRQEVLARGHLRPRARRAGQRAQPRAQGRRLGLARGLPGRDRQAAAGRGRPCQVIYSGVGGITESDVNLAAASDAIILGFNVRPVGEARQLADREGVEIRTYSVIYRAIDELRDAMQGMLAPEEVEEAVGSLEVRAIFRASKIGVIAGCYVTDGKVTRGAKVPARPRRHDRLRRRDRARCGASTTTCARSRPASSAASSSRTTWTSRKAT